MSVQSRVKHTAAKASNSAQAGSEEELDGWVEPRAAVVVGLADRNLRAASSAAQHLRLRCLSFGVFVEPQGVLGPIHRRDQ